VISKIHDNFSIITQFVSISVVLMNFIIQITLVVCFQLQEKDLEKRWEKVRKFVHLNFLVANDIGILHFNKISNITIMMTLLMPRS
jgi:hypothetical protein